MPKEPIDLEQAVRGFTERVRVEFGLEARSDASVSQDGTTTIAGLSSGAEGQHPAADVTEPAQGRAVARAMDSFDDAAAYGLLVRNIERADVDTQMAGQVRVDGTGEAEGRGLSIGLQEFLDPDEVDGAGPGANDGGGDEGEAFGPGPEDALPRFDGAVETGAGNDRFTGRFAVTADAGDEELIFAASNGVIVDRDEVPSTGAGDDVILALDRLDARGGGGGPDGSGEADAVDVHLDDDFTLFGGTTSETAPITSEEGAVLDLGAGDDRLVGTAEADAAGAGSRAVGLFVGEDGSVVSGAGDDRIEGRAEILGPGEAFGVAGDGTGRIETGEGRDTLQIGMAFGEFARSGEAGAVEDGVTLESGGFEMIATGIESFDFEGEVLTAEELLARISETPEAPAEEEPAPPAEPVMDAPDPDEPPVGLV